MEAIGRQARSHGHTRPHLADGASPARLVHQFISFHDAHGDAACLGDLLHLFGNQHRRGRQIQLTTLN